MNTALIPSTLRTYRGHDQGMWYTEPQYLLERANVLNVLQLFGVVSKSMEAPLYLASSTEKDKLGYVNQYGLSRKVGCFCRLLSPCCVL